MSYAILFPGQGSQHPDMLPWLEAETSAAAPLLAMARHLGHDWRARLSDPEELSRNRFAQVLVTGVSLAAWGAVSAHLTEGPAIVAGYSVGELAAVACAGAFDPTDAVALAAQRAQAMDAAAGGVPGGLLSVSGLHQDSIARQLAGWPLEVAIRIGPDHLILAGATGRCSRPRPCWRPPVATARRCRSASPRIRRPCARPPSLLPRPSPASPGSPCAARWPPMPPAVPCAGWSRCGPP